MDLLFLSELTFSAESQNRQFNFSAYCADKLYSYFGEGKARMCRSREYLALANHLDVASMISVCQDHGPSFLGTK